MAEMQKITEVAEWQLKNNVQWQYDAISIKFTMKYLSDAAWHLQELSLSYAAGASTDNVILKMSSFLSVMITV